MKRRNTPTLVHTEDSDLSDPLMQRPALGSREERREFVFRHANNWYWETDSELRFTFISGQRHKLTGRMIENSIGKRPWESHPSGSLEPTADVHEALFRRYQSIRDFMFTLSRSDGTRVTLGVTADPVFDDSGAFLGYRGLTTDLTQLSQAEESVHESTALFRHTFEAAGVGIVHTNLDGQWMRFNPKFIEQIGYSRDELERMTYHDITLPDDLVITLNNVERLLSGKVTSYKEEKRFRRKNGSIIWVSATVTLVRKPDGAPDYFISFISDISAQKEAEAALRQSEERFRSTFENAPIGIGQTSAEDGRWLRYNDKILELTGYSREEISQMTIRDVTHPDDWDADDAGIEKLLAGEIDVYSTEKRYIRKDKSIRWVSLTSTLSCNADGMPDYFLSIIEDIDDRKRTDAALREAEERFRAFWDNSPFGQSLKDTEGRFITVNRQYRENYQLTNEQIIGNTQREAHDTLWSDKVVELEKQVLETGITGSVDAQAVSPTKGLRTMNIVKFPVFDGDGNIVGLGGIGYDTTEERRAQRLLQESETRFRQTFEQAAVGMVHTSPEGKWLRVNQRFCDMIGYDQEELENLTIDDVSYRGESYNQETELRRRLLAREIESYQREKRYVRKDGSILWAQITASLAATTPDMDAYLIVAVEDISARKEAEQALQRRIHQQAAVAAIGHYALGDTSAEDVFSHAAEAVVETLGIDQCLIFSYDAKADRVDVKAAGANPEAFVGRSYTPENDVTRQMLLNAGMQATSFRNLNEEHPGFTTPLLREIGTVSGATINLFDSTDDDYHAALAVHSVEERQFSEDDLNFLQALANILSAKIADAHIQAALHDREQSLNAILDNAAEAIVAANEAGEIELYNRAAVTTFGYQENEIIGKDIRQIIPMSYGSTPDETATGPSAPASPTEIRGRRKDGSLFPLEVSTTRVELPGRTLQVTIMRDVTEQRALQSQLIQASKLATVGEMAAGMAHELNQPLNVMRMAADNILLRMENDKLDPEYAVKNLKLIGEQSGRMGRIILHMRAFSRNDTADFEPFDPVEPVRRACELMSQQLHLANVMLETDFPDTLPKVMGRAPQLEQVILNLVTNAQDSIVEHPGNGPADFAGRLKITASLNEDGNAVRIVSRDTGGGIPESVRDKLFDPFFTTKDVGVGTGLGLSVSYGIISSMNGTIDARNLEVGAEFEITLPIMQPQP